MVVATIDIPAVVGPGPRYEWAHNRLRVLVTASASDLFVNMAVHEQYRRRHAGNSR